MNSFFETILLKVWISESVAHAIFAEAARMNVHLGEDVARRRGRSTITFEFDDDDAFEGGSIIIEHVVEAEVEVDGESFGHTAGDERDALEDIFQLRGEVFRGVPSVFCEEFSGFVIREEICVFQRNFDAFFISTASIIFIFNFEEGQSRGDVSAKTDFFACFFSVLMSNIHRLTGRIVIDRVVRQEAFSIDFLNAVIGGRAFKQFGE